MPAKTLYDAEKSQPISAPAPDISAQEMLDFCEYYSVEFHAMGTPPGVSDPNKWGWDDPTRFRVSTIGAPARGVTLQLDEVREWKDGVARLDEGQQAQLDELMSAAETVGSAQMVLEQVMLERLVREAVSWFNSWAVKNFNGSDVVKTLISNLDSMVASGRITEDAITSARLCTRTSEVSGQLTELLHQALLPLGANGRAAFFESAPARDLRRIAGEMSKPQIAL